MSCGARQNLRPASPFSQKSTRGSDPTMQVCSVPGCPELSDRGKCPTHRRAAEAKRGSAAERGYDAAWQKRSKAFLASHPVCVLCGGKAEVSDHWPKTRRQLVAEGVRDPDADQHLRPLCTRDHNAETAKAARMGNR